MAPSYKLLTTVSMVGMVGVPIVLFYLLTKKKPSYLNNSNCTIGTRLETKRRVSGSAAAKRRVSGSAAAEVIGCNDDLLTKILVLLPVKTVVRFKCVSKQWSSLISSEFGFFGSAAAEVIGCNDDLLTKILVLLPVKTVVRFKCVSKQWSSLISSAFFGFFGSAAAEVIGCNDDLLTKILVLLPVKTVGRFKCVSKQWSSLISSEFFTRRHVGRVDSRQPSFIMTDVHGFPELFICHHTKKKLVRVSIPSPIKNPLCKYNILQSWNGLLLISIKFLREDLREDRIDYVVFNPTTKQYRLLQLDGYRPLTICFMCDPSKPEYYKVLMITSITPYIYSVYDLATQEWSHNMQGGDPFKDGAAILEFFKDGADLGFCISTALLLNILVSSIKQGQNHLYTPVTRFPEGSAYDNYIFESVEYANLVQVKTFLGENKLKFRVGVWIRKIWEISDTDTLDFNFENSSVGVRMLGMMREKGAAIPDAVFLFHVPGQLLIYKINQGVKVLVDYRREHFYVKDEWQFEHAHPFIHTFAAV